MAVYEMFWGQQQEGIATVGEWLEVDSIEITAGRVALVQAHTRASDGVLGPQQQISLYNLDGQWTVAQRPSIALLVASFKHALDANIEVTLNKAHDAVKLATVNSKRMLHPLTGVMK